MTNRRNVIAAALTTVILLPGLAGAQTYTAPQPRRQFITLSYNWPYTFPQHLKEHPLEDLLGTDVETGTPPYQYKTADGATQIDLLEFKRKGQGVGVSVYPFGMKSGATLGVRGSIETLPDMRFAFDGPGALDSYAFTGALAYDVGAGLYVADISHGWGLGAYAFVVGGIGRITSDLGGGSRRFAEGGGGVQTGPIGFEISAKFGWNRMSDPVEHRFLTVPINMRATVSF